MRRIFPRSLLLTLVLLPWLAGGCATVPATVAIGDQEGQRVGRLFLETLAAQRCCPRGLDAQVRVNLRSIWQNGSLQGFVQGMAPSYLKFVGVNPLGQPMLILGSDGESFRAVVAPEAKWYEGAVETDAFRKYAPAGFDPARGFFWLIGRLAPDNLTIEAVEQDAEGGGQWLTARYSGEQVRQQVLFDPHTRLVRRHLVLGADGKPVVDVSYDAYQQVAAGQPEVCRLPGMIRVESSAHAGASMEILLGDWLTETTFTPLDFVVPVPPDFVRVPVQ